MAPSAAVQSFWERYVGQTSGCPYLLVWLPFIGTAENNYL